MILIYLVLIVFFSLLLVKATDILIVNLKSLSASTRLGRFAVTSFLLALGTSLPELFIGITSALEGEPNFALGNVIGANIANLSLVIGGAAIIGGGINVQGLFLHRDVFYAFLAGASPLLLLWDRKLSRVDGVILICLYGFYAFWLFAERFRELAGGNGRESLLRRLIRKINSRESKAELAWIFLGLALVLFSANILVKVACRLAIVLNMPILLIGLFLVAIGTTLPELIFGIKTVRQKEAEMVFGNLLGSLVANSTLIIGFTSLISPIKIAAFDEYLLATMAFLLIFGAFFLFIKTKKRLESWEGAFLLGFYLAFFLVEIFHP